MKVTWLLAFLGGYNGIKGNKQNIFKPAPGLS